MLGQLEHSYSGCLALNNINKTEDKFVLNDFYLKYLSVVG